jgi:hypothetical protein
MGSSSRRGMSLAFTTSICGSTRCASASSQRKVIRDIMDLVSALVAGRVSDRGVCSSRRPIDDSMPMREPWK